MLDRINYEPEDAIKEQKEVNNLLRFGSRISKIARFNGLQKLARQLKLAPPEEHHAIGLIAEFLFDESPQIRKYAVEVLRRKPILRESADAVLMFLSDQSEVTLHHLLDEIIRVMADARDGEYSSYINQHGNFLGRYCIKILSNLNKENIFPQADSNFKLGQRAIFDNPLRYYLEEYRGGKIKDYLGQFMKSDDPYLIRYNVPRKLSTTLRWIFYKKYDRFLNENIL